MIIIKFLFLIYICLVLLPDEIYPDDVRQSHHRSKRIANNPKPKKDRIRIPATKANPWGGPGGGTTNTTTAEEDFVDNPPGYFAKPGMADGEENYEYPEAKFNKPHLVQPEWKNEFTASKRTYKIEKSKLGKVVPLKAVKSPEAVKSIFGDDLLR